MDYLLHLLQSGRWVIFGTHMMFRSTGEGFPITKKQIDDLRPHLKGGVDPLLKIEIWEASELLEGV